MQFDFLIVGAGFTGSVVAERLATAGYKILIIDQRNHIGGNAHDKLDQYGVLIHQYGPHIFHTNSEKIFEYLSRFTDWRPYEHRVLAKVGDKLLPIPINQTTINKLYDLNLDEDGVRDYLNKVRIPVDPIKTSEDVVLNNVGQDLYEKFFKGYTKKQWNLDPSELGSEVTSRIPTRTNTDDRYFTDNYQYMPLKGYTEIFRNILDHKNIKIELETNFSDIKEKIKYRFLIFTGPIDAYFDYCHGRLPYRSLKFNHEHIQNCLFFQKTATINYPNDYKYTRITEFKHLTHQTHSGTSIVKEFPTSEGDPYYPIPTKQNQSLYKKYEAEAAKLNTVFFLGRLGQYRYYNMDQVVGAALKFSETFLKK